MFSRLTVTVLALISGLALLFAGAAAAESPQMNTPASISGTAAIGHELTAHNGTWLYNDGSSCKAECSYAYQWQRCTADGSSCVDIGGATGRFYTVKSADAGSRLRAMETVTKNDCNAHGVDCRDVSKSAPSVMTGVVGGSAPSAPTPPAAPPAPAVPAPQAPFAPTATSAPTVSGVPMFDETLRASPGTWTGSPALTLEWLRCDPAGQNCAGMGVTADTYRVIAFDIGKTLRVRVIGRNHVAARDALSDATPVVSELKPTEAKPTLEASKVLAPHKLVISNLRARPARLVRRSAVTLSFTVTDSRGFKISGAVAKAVVLPTRALALPQAATSADDGSVVLVFKPLPRVDLRKLKAVTIVVTATRPGDRPTSPRGSIVRVKLGIAKPKTTRR